MNLKIKKLHPDAIVPTYGTKGAACFDIYALHVDGYSELHIPVSPGAPVICSTGLSFDIPEGYALMVYSRSGHGFTHDTRLANCVGIIDSDYVGELMVKLTRDEESEDDFFAVKKGDRIAQAMLVPVNQVTFEEVEELKSTERGTKGFGSSGA